MSATGTYTLAKPRANKTDVGGGIPVDTTDTTPRAVAKSILSQLFEKRIGNIQLLQVLTEAHERSRTATTDKEYDEIIWKAVSDSLASPLPGAKELVLVVDGTDEAHGGEASLLQKLSGAANAAFNLRLITLGGENPAKAPSQRVLPITEDLILDDIMAVVRAQSENTDPFRSMPELDQETAVARISKASGGSFLWAKLAAKRVCQATDTEDLGKSVDVLVDSKPSITEFVEHSLQSADVKDWTKHMVLWIATARRPLSVRELSALASVQVDKGTTLDQTDTDILGALRPVNSLVYFQDGLAYLRHGLIHTAIVDIFDQGKLVPGVKDRHEDLARRLLLYIQSKVTQQHGISLQPLDTYDTNQLLARHPLLDFAILHWPVHVSNSSVFINQGTAGVARAFAKVMPKSTIVLLLQGTLWQHRPEPMLLQHQIMVTDIYRQLLTPNHLVTLQAMILQAMMYRRVNLTDEAIPLFHEATTISKTLLGVRDTMTMELADIFVNMSSNKTESNVKDISGKREEILLLLVECYKVQYGQNSDNVVATLRLLVEHYRITHQEQKEQEIQESLQSTTAADAAEEVSDREGDLLVSLRRRRGGKKQGRFVLNLDVEEHDERSDRTRMYDFELSLKRAEKYVAEGRLDLAEAAFVEIWQRSSREYRVHHSDVWEERRLRAILSYTKFLQAQEREVDTCAILSSVWEDYKHTNAMTMTSTFAGLFYEMSRVMKVAGLSSESLSVLQHTAQYYRSTSQTQSSTFTEIQQSIETSTTEIIQTISSSGTRITSESNLEAIVLQACKSQKIDQATLTAVFHLVGLNTSQHRWQDGIRLTKSVLHVLWHSLFFSSVQGVTVPAEHADSCVELAQILAQCYHTRRQLSKEEDVRLRIYYAMRACRGVDDKRREHVTRQLLDFYEAQYQTDRLISIRQEMLEDFTEHYGEKHPTVINMLWQLAELARPRPISVQYYQKIIRVLNGDSSTTKPETFEAVVIVASDLWRKGLFSDASHYYKMLLETFHTSPKVNSKLQDQSFVREVFTRYTHHLRNAGTAFSVVHRVMANYHTQCKTVFGSTAAITIQATIMLANLCQESELHGLEAINLYEELLQIDSHEINHEEISAYLDSIYEEQTGVTTSSEVETMSSTQVHRAVTALSKKLTTIRENYGWAHEESLVKLSELVQLRRQQHESRQMSIELREATANILSTETSSSRLIAAASTIVAGYIATDQVHEAMELEHEIYRQIVMKDTSHAGTFEFDISSRGRDSLVFLAQLEHSVRRNTATMTEILASLTTQFSYFQEVHELMRTKSSSFHRVTVATTRLYQFLVDNGRQTAAAAVFEDFVQYFLEAEGGRFKITKPAQVNIFLQALLQHFENHKSHDFVRSVGISANHGVARLLREHRYDAACDLADAAFAYIAAHDSYRTPVMAKLVLTLGISFAGQDPSHQPSGAARKSMIQTSTRILRDVLHVLSDLDVSLEQINLDHLNKVIGLLGEARDHRTLSWLLGVLWDNREDRGVVTLPLGQRYIMARYLVGESTAAVRLGEDIFYNCRRVHGTRHPATLEMAAFLSRLYTTVAQRYQTQSQNNAGGREVAKKYLKKSAAVHEGVLRAFTEPEVEAMEAIFDGCRSPSGSQRSSFDFDAGEDYGEEEALDDGQYVREHLRHLKLVVERLGAWPKDYSEYERLGADVFRQYGNDLEGVERVDKWDLGGYGSGKAEADDDLFEADFKDWELVSRPVPGIWQGSWKQVQV